MKKIVLVLAMLLLSMLAMADDFLPVEKAFSVKITSEKAHQLDVHYHVAKGYKLYRDRLAFELNGKTIASASIQFPKAEEYFDEGLGQKMAVYHQDFVLPITMNGQADKGEIKLRYQGCADAGLCYPPVTKVLPYQLAQTNVSQTDKPEVETTAQSSAAQVQASSAGSKEDVALNTLKHASLLNMLVIFFGFGLLLSLTPCVLPMIPILSTIILGQQQQDKRHNFMLSLSYSLGMATVYTMLGVLAGLAGASMAAYLQQPWVLILFALLLVGLALSMFDVYQLQMPASIQTRLSSQSGQLRAGSLVNTYFMGLLSGLVVGPCVAAPLAGALIYISQTKDVLLGGSALFSMAMGMSVPLLLLGISAGSLLPRVGAWMDAVKHLFGVMLFAVALWMLNPVLSGSLNLFLWGVLAIFTALVFRPFEQIQSGHFLHVLKLTLALVLLLIGGMQIVGAGMGHQQLLSPLKSADAQLASRANPTLNFRQVNSLEELKTAIAQSDQPVLVDFYADWCTSCQELEHFTFADANVQQQLNRYLLLRVDVTKGSPEDQQLMKFYQVFGPPTILIFSAHKPVVKQKITGFVDANELLKELREGV